MEKIEIAYNKLEEAIAVMKEVAKWGREQDYRVWPDEWLEPLILLDFLVQNFRNVVRDTVSRSETLT